MKKYVLVGLLTFSSYLLKAQASLYWEPEVSYTWSSSERWSYNIELTVMPSIIEGGEENLNIQRTDFSFFTTYKIFGGKSISGGYQFRLAEPFFVDDYGFEHRLTEQFSFLSYIGDRRLAHRLRAEQRFKRNEYENRFRYRLSYEVPLKGEQLDPGETYLISSGEFLYSFNKNSYGIDTRIFGGLGWYFSNKRKLETGLQYRAENLNSGIENVIHIITSYYINR